MAARCRRSSGRRRPHRWRKRAGRARRGRWRCCPWRVWFAGIAAFWLQPKNSDNLGCQGDLSNCIIFKNLAGKGRFLGALVFYNMIF